ncbi:uncharacterized protein LOC144163184 isoform X2 [Haemaphysalis longicornis]
MDLPTAWLTLGTLVSVCSSAVSAERQFFYSAKHYFGAPQTDDSDSPAFWMRPPKALAPPLWRPTHHRGVIQLPYIPTLPLKEYPVSSSSSTHGQPSDGPYSSSGVLQGLSYNSDDNGADAGVFSSILSQGGKKPQANPDSTEWPSRTFDRLRWSGVFTHLLDTLKTKKTYKEWWKKSQFETKPEKKKTVIKRKKFKQGSNIHDTLVMKHEVHHGANHVIKHPKKPKPKHPANRFPKPTANDFDDPFPQFVTPAATLKPTPVFWSVSPDKPKEHHEWWTNINFETKKKVTNKPKRPAKPKDNPNQAKPLVKPSQKLSPTPSLDRATTPGAELPIESTGEGTDVEGSQTLPPHASKKRVDKAALKSFAQGGATSEKASGGNPPAKEATAQRIPVVDETISAMIERFRNASKDRTKTTLAFKRDETASSSSPTIVTTTPRPPEQMSDAEVEKAYNFNPPGTIVEMAVFYDPDCRDSFVEAFGSAERFEDAVWTLIEQVQVFYKRPWLKRAIHIVVTQLTFLEKPPNELMRSSEADELLKGFANFTGDRNAPDGEQGHWDVALLLTGKDLHAHNNGKKDPSVLGKAYIGGVCSGHFDNVVVEFGSVNPHRRPMTTFGLQASNVVAHELAHNLGVYHDGPPTNAECSLDRYMMGPWRTANTTTWWSNCSLSVLEQLPEHPKSTCLKPLSADRLRELLPLNRWRSWPLPGQRWDADDQCRLFLKSQAAHHGAKPADMKAVCGKLECASPTRIGLFNAGHALEGTYCGGSNWCHENSCVPFPKSLPVVPGGWTEWDMVADCSQPCLEDSVALIHMKRSCTMPARKNTLEGCEGDGVTLRPCDINANKKAPKCDRKKTNQDYINEKCAIFSQMKSELKPTGTQVPYSAAQSWRACAIHCGYHNGAFIAAKFFLNDETKETGVLPDGARCHFDEKTGAAYYCQQGLCATLLQSLAGLELKRTSQVLELDEEDWAEDTAGRRYVERFMEYVPGEDFPVLDAKRVPKADARISVDDL